MFNFHKPKVYRSLNGCCICRAKSSSSRFTNSQRYQADFANCFQVVDDRSGEICNACVLLVKRWKKLPKGSTRNWKHVVDARAGPGTKSMSKIKSKNNNYFDKFNKKHKKSKKTSFIKKPQLINSVSVEDCCSDLSSDRSSPLQLIDSDSSDEDEEYAPVSTQQPAPSQRRRQSLRSALNALNTQHSHKMEKIKDSKTSRRSDYWKKQSKRPAAKISSFLDLSYWRLTEICCGRIFKGTNGEVLVDPKLLTPCRQSCTDATMIEIGCKSQSRPTDTTLSEAAAYFISQDNVSIESTKSISASCLPDYPSSELSSCQAEESLTPLNLADQNSETDKTPCLTESHTYSFDKKSSVGYTPPIHSEYSSPSLNIQHPHQSAVSTPAANAVLDLSPHAAPLFQHSPQYISMQV